MVFLGFLSILPLGTHGASWAPSLFDTIHHLFLAQKGSILGAHGAPLALPLFDAVHRLFLAQKGSIPGLHGAPWARLFSTQFAIYLSPRRARFWKREEERRKKEERGDRIGSPSSLARTRAER